MAMSASGGPHAAQASSSDMHLSAEGHCQSVPAAAASLADTTVRVALRARPLVARERLEGSKPCISVHEDSGLVMLGKQRQFVFDQVFGPHTPQEQVYTSCVSDLVDAVVEGYNATVLAYGPTGSGKTYTMGTGSALHCMPEQQGIIPRVIKRLFDVIKQADDSRAFVVRAQFLEIHNEEVRDLLAPVNSGTPPGSNNCSGGGSTGSYLGCLPEKQRGSIAIRECPDGQILVTGAREEVASSYEDLVQLLDAGALARTTGATALNEQSSRSHAIFTIIVEQSIRMGVQGQQQQQAGSSRSSRENSNGGNGECTGSPLTPRARLLQQLKSSSSVGGVEPTAAADGSLSPRQQQSSCGGGSSNSSSISVGDGYGVIWPGSCGGAEQVEYRCAKFHMVDLAGSERTKRTGAVGARFKETVTINQGLLALGNVISALGDEKRRLPGRHVPYRDSKLTRLLQDSLGGNSKTLMIACVSSADDVLEENLNTLKYASRARRIRNRPVVNKQQLGNSTSCMASDIQVLQLLLLRRYTQHVLGPVTCEALPPVLLADVRRCNDASALQMLRELQALAAEPEKPLSSGAMLGLQQYKQEQQHPTHQLQALNQPEVAFQAQLTTQQSPAETHQNIQPGFSTSRDFAVQLVQAMNAAKQKLLLELEQLHTRGQISSTVRKQLGHLLEQQLRVAHDQHSIQLSSSSSSSSSKGTRLQSHPLPAIDASCCSESAAEAIRAAATVVEASAAAAAAEAQGDCEDVHRQLHNQQQQQQIENLQQELVQVQTQLADTTAQLQIAHSDLTRDEEIFAERVREMSKLRDELAAVQQERHEADQHMQQLRAGLRRWKAIATSMQGCAAATSPASAAESPPSSPTRCNILIPGNGRAPNSSLAAEVSFAAFTEQQQQQQSCLQEGGSADSEGPAEALLQDCQAAKDASKQTGGGEADAAAARDDQVLFDDELASYISETDYTDLDARAFEEDSHLLAELQVVMADKAALEEEKAAAQVEAVAAQRNFERSRMLLEGQLNQLAAAISSQERLISTLQSNEAEARQMGALYLDRCRELETEITELNLEMEELTAALARVEADAAASAEDKARLRFEYEARIKDVVTQMGGLQRQLKCQDGLRLDKERQRTAGRVQQLQALLTAMQVEQATLKRRLQEKLAAQDKASVEKARELTALRKAAEAAKRKVAELEDENRRQRAALRSRMEEALHAQHEALQAQRQLKKLAAQAAVQRSRHSSPCPHKRLHVHSSGSCSGDNRPAFLSDCGSKNSSRTSSSSVVKPQGVSPAASVCSSTCGLRCGSEQVLRSHLKQQQHPPAHRIEASKTHSSSSSSGSGWFSHQLELLTSKQSAEDRLQELQARLAAAMLQREQLISAKAQLDIKTLRRRRSSSYGIRDRITACEQPSALHPAEKCLLEGLADQLDASEAEFEHLTQQLQQQQAAVKAAATAAGDVMSKVAALSSVELSEMLQQAMDMLVVQSSRLQAILAKASKMGMDLVEQQQQVEQATCCLHSTQLQHHAELANLQREHEQRLMAVLRQHQDQQAAIAAVAAAARAPLSIHQISHPDACPATRRGVAAAGAAAFYGRSAAAAAAAALLGHQASQGCHVAADSCAHGIAATIAAVFQAGKSKPMTGGSVGWDDNKIGSSNGTSRGSCHSNTDAAVKASPRPAGPQLSELVACLAQQPQNQYSKQEQQQAAGIEQKQTLQQMGHLQQDSEWIHVQKEEQQQQQQKGEGVSGSNDQSGVCTGQMPSANHATNTVEPEAEISLACTIATGQNCSSEESEDQLGDGKGELCGDEPEQPQHEPLHDTGTVQECVSEPSPSKLQAKLAAYRKYLKQASPQKTAAAAAASVVVHESSGAGPVPSCRQQFTGPARAEAREPQKSVTCTSFSDERAILQHTDSSTTAKTTASAQSTTALAGCAATCEDISNAGMAAALQSRVRTSIQSTLQHSNMANCARFAAAAGPTPNSVAVQKPFPRQQAGSGAAATNTSPKHCSCSVLDAKPNGPGEYDLEQRTKCGSNGSKRHAVQPRWNSSNSLRSSMQDIREEIAAAGGAAPIVEQFNSSLLVELGSSQQDAVGSCSTSAIKKQKASASHSCQLEVNGAGKRRPSSSRCVPFQSLDAPLQEALSSVNDAVWRSKGAGSMKAAPSVLQSFEDNMFCMSDQSATQVIHATQSAQKQLLQQQEQRQQRSTPLHSRNSATTGNVVAAALK